jgi:hypothetical protein
MRILCSSSPSLLLSTIFFLPIAAEGFRSFIHAPTRWTQHRCSGTKMFTPKLLHWLFLYVLWFAVGKAEHDTPSTGITPVPRGLATRALPEGTCTKDIPCANKACCNGSVVSLIPWDRLSSTGTDNRSSVGLIQSSTAAPLAHPNAIQRPSAVNLQILRANCAPSMSAAANSAFAEPPRYAEPTSTALTYSRPVHTRTNRG